MRQGRDGAPHSPRIPRFQNHHTHPLCARLAATCQHAYCGVRFAFVPLQAPLSKAPAAAGGAAEKPKGGKPAGDKPAKAAGDKPKGDKPAKGGDKKADGGKEVKKETQLGLACTKAEDFGAWYSNVVIAGEMIEYYDISGCYILRPWAYSIWEQIQRHFDGEIKKLGVENAYFPLFVSERALNAEKDHVEGFAPEVAWVTRSGQSELESPIAVRPTSETVMYPIYANWIRSHR